jgi:hypothetical protein
MPRSFFSFSFVVPPHVALFLLFCFSNAAGLVLAATVVCIVAVLQVLLVLDKLY